MPSPHHRRPRSPGAAGEHALLSHEDDAARAEAVVRRVDQGPHGRERVLPHANPPDIRLTGSGDLVTRGVPHTALAAVPRVPEPLAPPELTDAASLDARAVATPAETSPAPAGQGRLPLLPTPASSPRGVARAVARVFPHRCAAPEVTS
ncbi:hypothetical protein ACFXEL_34975 [Streptomyces sp. NPDC059382]|uniref:hypothetical protein n=1 Tax=Streptomyces sp. NPDC059382 TaxID=3346816 RepID=UPI0036CA7B1F